MASLGHGVQDKIILVFYWRLVSSYIYAPKSDKKLRSNWYELWSSEEISNIQNCSFNFKLSGLDFGIGFSPLSLVNEDLSSRNGKKSFREINSEVRPNFSNKA